MNAGSFGQQPGGAVVPSPLFVEVPQKNAHFGGPREEASVGPLFGDPAGRGGGSSKSGKDQGQDLSNVPALQDAIFQIPMGLRHGVSLGALLFEIRVRRIRSFVNQKPEGEAPP